MHQEIEPGTAPITRAPTFQATIYCGSRVGPTVLYYGKEMATAICQRYADDVGLCVTITETEFIYTGGCEPGIAVGLINYPRFPSSPDAITKHAIILAERLMVAFAQKRVSIVTTNETLMLGEK